MPRRMLPALVLLAGLAPVATAAAQAPLPPSLTIDTAFAPSSGINKFDFTSGTAADVTSAVLVHQDRIFTIGETRDSTGNANIGITARRPDGTFDTGFSGDGKHTIAIAPGTGRDAAFSAALLPDGRLRIAAATDVDPGTATNLDVALVGINFDGTDDSSFGGGDGREVFAVGTANDTPTRMALDHLGRIAVTGATVDNSKDDYFVSLREPNGSPAAGFGTAGVIKGNRGGGTLNDKGVDIAFRPGGGLIVALQVETNLDANINDWHAVLHAFTFTGADDPGFSDDGDYDLPVGNPDTIPGGLIVYAGRLWVTGSTKTGQDTDTFLVRMEPNGTGLQARRFDLRGTAPANLALTTQGNALAVVPATPPTLVIGGFLTSESGTDWAAGAFNNLDADLSAFGYGDVVFPTPGQGTIVGVAPGGADWAAVGGSLLDLNSADTSFGTARLLIDADKACDLGVTLAQPLELVFTGDAAASVGLKVTNNGTKACAGTVSVASPYVLRGTSETGLLAPGASMTTSGTSIAYTGPRKAEDVLQLKVQATGDANPANDSVPIAVKFRYCDLQLRADGSRRHAPVDGSRRYEFTIRNAGTAPCARVRLAVIRGGSGTPSARFSLGAGRSASDSIRAAVALGQRVGTRSRALVIAAVSADAVDIANDQLSTKPLLVRGGDSGMRRAGRRVFSGTAKGAGKPLSRSARRLSFVEVSVQRIGGTRCRWLASKRGTLVTRVAGPYGKCDNEQWVRVTGRSRWRLVLKRVLPRGRYVVRSRAVLANGFAEASFTAKDRNRRSFTVR